ncbi:SDR family NAD(P)-dependent oxidoreductase [Microbaculum sp. FT89]|uniref:SDR family NAD(P)-dependent oxidoreductase n=1 Tax=Microbaculum sp. FT89 TaxID=3447298 RepID=UPI003F5360A7
MSLSPWKTAWIVGASSGIGRAVALRLARDGVRVAASARDVAALEDLAAEAGGLVTVHPLDVTEDGAAARVLGEIEATHGPVDLAILSAGIWMPFRLDDIRVGAFADSVAVNYLGAVACIAALLPGMRDRDAGQIAIVASVAGYFGLPKSATYGPTKAALINLAESLRTEMDGSGVTVSLVNPGFVATRLTEKNSFPMPLLMQPDAAAERIAKGLRSRRFEVAFPRRFAWGMKLLGALPYPAFFWIVRKFVSRR